VAARTAIPGADFPLNLWQNPAKLGPKRAGGGSVQLRRGGAKSPAFRSWLGLSRLDFSDIAPHSVHPIDGGTHDGAVMRG